MNAATKSYFVICLSMNGDQQRETFASDGLAEFRADQLRKSGGRVAFVCESAEPFEACKSQDYRKRGDR